MQYWLTTHTPPDRGRVPRFVYAKKKYAKSIGRVRAGDRVFFYETAGTQRTGLASLVATVWRPDRPNRISVRSS